MKVLPISSKIPLGITSHLRLNMLTKPSARSVSFVHFDSPKSSPIAECAQRLLDLQTYKPLVAQKIIGRISSSGSLVSRLLTHTNTAAYHEVLTYMLCNQSSLLPTDGCPKAVHYFRFFEHLKKIASSHWERIDNPGAILPGDILAYAPHHPTNPWKGYHIMVIKDAYVQNGSLRELSLIDYSSPHSSEFDSRASEISAIGISTGKFDFDPNHPSVCWGPHQKPLSKEFAIARVIFNSFSGSESFASHTPHPQQPNRNLPIAPLSQIA